MKKIYIHCGFHKTATSYIQRMLLNNNGLFRSQLDVLNRVLLETEAVRLAAVAYSTDATSSAREELKKALSEMANEVLNRPKASCLITDEAFFGPHLGQRGELRLYPKAADIAQMMVEAFEPASAEIMLYSRNIEQWLKSVYNQAVKRERYSKSYTDFVKEVKQPISLATVANDIEQKVGKERVVLFELEADSKHWFGTGGQLFDHLGLDRELMESVIKPDRLNESLSPWTLWLMRRTNASSLSDARAAWVRVQIKKLQSKFRQKASKRSAS